MKLQKCHLAFAIALSLAASGSALAKKPEWAGKGGKPAAAEEHAEHSERGDSKRSKLHDAERFFNSERADKIRQHYASQGDGKGPKKCPPGLAKKNNGCMPPGLAKNWNRGEPLPRDVEYQRASDALLRELGRTPEGQEILRVGNDILLIESSTRRVIDAIEDLGSLF